MIVIPHENDDESTENNLLDTIFNHPGGKARSDVWKVFGFYKLRGRQRPAIRETYVGCVELLEMSIVMYSPRFLCRPTAFFSTCWSRGTSESSTYGKQRICRCNSASTHFHVSWLSNFIFYPKPLYKSLHQSFFYSFITILPSEKGVTLHYSTILPCTIISPCWLSFSNLQTWSRNTN